jgi:hypothetical protein
MAAKLTYSIVKTDGTAFTCNSTRAFTHAVIAAGMQYDNGVRDDVPAVLGFRGSLKAAEKLAATPGWYGVKVVEATTI